MENKINIAELLKDCPRGMELDCVLFNNVTLECVSDEGIWIKYIDSNGKSRVIYLTSYGGMELQYIETKCIIFPKGKTTWEGFVLPKPKFKCGDIVACDCPNGNSQLFIFKEYDDNNDAVCYLFLNTHGRLDIDEFDYKIDRLATEEEKQRLFDAIKANGYKWNAETKTLEKLPKFKVGNKIVDILRKLMGASGTQGVISEITDDKYIFTDGSYMSISNQDSWGLVPKKFDITTLKPFESRVLVRDKDTDKWKSSFWGFYDIDNAMNYPYECCGNSFAKCIPYEGNEHLLSTTNDCDDFFKTWKE